MPKKFFTYLFFIGFFLGINNFAFAENLKKAKKTWIKIGDGGDHIYSARSGTFTVEINDKGEKVAKVVAQVMEKKKKSVVYGKFEVKEKDCLRTYGQGRFLDFSDKELFDFEFIISGKTVSDSVAEWLCIFLEIMNEEKSATPN